MINNQHTEMNSSENQNSSNEQKWREEFEKSSTSDIDLTFHKKDNNFYANKETHLRWSGCLAARTKAQEEIDHCKSEQERLVRLCQDRYRESERLLELTKNSAANYWHDKFQELNKENEQLNKENNSSVKIIGGQDEELEKLRSLVGRAKPLIEPRNVPNLATIHDWLKEYEEVMK